jgi:hypothetical protein
MVVRTVPRLIAQERGYNKARSVKDVKSAIDLGLVFHGHGLRTKRVMVTRKSRIQGGKLTGSVPEILQGRSLFVVYRLKAKERSQLWQPRSTLASRPGLRESPGR